MIPPAANSFDLCFKLFFNEFSVYAFVMGSNNSEL